MSKRAHVEIHVAFQGGVALIDGQEYVFQRGLRLRADHPVVKKLGRAAFVPDGEELPNALVGLPPPNNDLTPISPALASGLRAYRRS